MTIRLRKTAPKQYAILIFAIIIGMSFSVLLSHLFLNELNILPFCISGIILFILYVVKFERKH
jgi:uncharacterized membrane-anchored protein YitT (DUF2179 family)